MSHKILITGKPGCGKSTLARWLAKGLALPWAGYETIKTDSTPAGPIYELYSRPDGAHAPISRLEDGKIRAVPETFDTLGCTCLEQALSGDAPVLLLDEIGRFEQNSPRFLSLIQAALSSRKTVIAVVKKEPLPHLQQLLSLPGAVVTDLDMCTPAQARRRLVGQLCPEKALRYGLTLRLYGVGKSFGPGPMELLEGVVRTGSLHRSAEEMGMAYSKAWKLIGMLEEEWGFPLLERRSGGSRGGSSVLTPEGTELLRRYEAMLAEVEASAHAAFEKQFGSLDSL